MTNSVLRIPLLDDTIKRNALESIKAVGNISIIQKIASTIHFKHAHFKKLGIHFKKLVH